MRGFGVWKLPTGRKRCRRILPLGGLAYKRCFRQTGHRGHCGWEHFIKTVTAA